MHNKPLTLCCALLSLLFSYNAFAQSSTHPIADEVASRQASFNVQPERALLRAHVPRGPWVSEIRKGVKETAFFTLQQKEVQRLEQDRPQELKLRLRAPDGQTLLLELYQATYLSPDFKVRKASAPDRPVPFDPGLHYRGIVNGEAQSLAMLLVHASEIAGVIEFRGRQYNLGRVEGQTDIHVLYPADAMADPPVRDCQADALPGYRPETDLSGNTRASGPDNCVEMYVEVDYDIYLGKGSVSAAATYASGLFSQVSTLYADESINLVLSEVFVWDVEDPYVGGSQGTLDYLIQFRQELNGDFNGADLAHLLGYQGGGGIAYLNVICSSTYGVGYSDIPSSYNEVPTYSWAVNVVTHEIGHNLGSPHTHDCAWNGDNTPIDNCGPVAGYTADGCFDNGQTPDDGTIMSYCHLVSGVGVSFVENFGQQPGDLIRDKVYNASCLSPCTVASTVDAAITSINTPNSSVCDGAVSPVVTLSNLGTETLNSVTINYTLDNNPTQTYNWTGNLVGTVSVDITLPEITFANGSHTLVVATDSPNGQADENTGNDEKSVNFSYNTDGSTILLFIDFDNYPGETSWSITDDNNNVLASGSGYNGTPSALNETICLPDGCFEFTIFDSYGDGICCGYGNGSYTLTDDATGTILVSGGEFDFEETTNFCISSDPACAQEALSINDSPIPTETYMTAQTITSSGMVPSESTVTFQAGQSITLQAGFQAEAGSSFIAYIEDCTPATLAQSDSTVLEEQSDRASLLVADNQLAAASMTIAPNPFRNETIIRYTLPEDRPTQLVLFDMLGRAQVLQPGTMRAAGNQEYRLNSASLSNGVYFVRLQAGDEVITQKVQVMKN